jgi:hypothetical protein
MYPQQIVILVSVMGAVGFLAYGSASGRLRRLIAPVLLLAGVAIYEAYMFYVWEKKVIAPIRIDLFGEIAVVAAALVYGLLVWFKGDRRNE